MTAKQDGVLTDVTILFFLREHAVSGYDIRKMIAHERVYRVIQISPATIYESLRRLETYGFVSAQEERMGNYPSKTVYAITQAGKDFHDERVEQYLQVGEQDSRQFTIGISCAAYLPPAMVKAALLVRVAKLQEQYTWTDQRLAKYPTLGGMQFPEWIHLVRARDLLRAEIAWTQEFAKRYEKVR